MENFIQSIYLFLQDILLSFYAILGRTGSTTIDVNRNNFLSFLDKQILNGDILSINMTFKEFFIYFGTLFLVVFFIALFVRFVFYIIKWVGGFLSD